MMSVKRSKRRSLTNGSKRNSLSRSFLRKHATLLSGTTTSSTLVQPEQTCIKVVVRSRPFNTRETGIGHKVVSVVDEKVLIFDPPQEEEDFFFQGRKQGHRDLNKKVNKNHKFMFDNVFDGSVSNEEIFEGSIQSLLDNLLLGFNCSVFAYGATGAGKTFTMLGSQTCPGLTYLIVKDLFRRIEEMTDKICELNVSYLEVYNETVKDLFRPSAPLIVRDDSKGVTIPGLSYQKPTSAEELLQMLHFGNKSRTQHPTDANAESSRSHAVFQIFIRIKDRLSGLSEKIQISKMSLIDLAGSERASVASSHGKARLREGANINQSLLALGSCINALADKKIQHVPYRNSKLTRILKDSLGGNCKTVMIAAVSPSSLSYEDTYNTLKYADRAKGIKVALNRNISKVDVHLTEYKKVIDCLREEVVCLKRKLEDQNTEATKHLKIDTVNQTTQTLFTGPIPMVRQQDNGEGIHSWRPPASKEPELNQSWVQTMDHLFQELAKIFSEILILEGRIRECKATLFWKQFSYERSCNLTLNKDKITQSQGKFENFSKSSQIKEERLIKQRDKHRSLYASKKEALNTLCSCANSEATKTHVEKRYLELDLLCEQLRYRHAVQIAVSNFKETDNAQKLCQQSILLNRKQQLILQGHNFLSSDLLTEFDTLLKQAEMGKEVAWVDAPQSQDPLHQEFLQHLTLPDPSNTGSHSYIKSLQLERPLATFQSPDISSAGDNCPASSEISTGLPVPQFMPVRQTATSTTIGPATPPPPRSGLTSPQRFRSCNGSPYPTGRPNSQKTTAELLEVLNRREIPLKRSLEKTFASPQTPTTSHLDPREVLFEQMKENISYSPISFETELTSRHGCTSTPANRAGACPVFTFEQREEPLQFSGLLAFSARMQSSPQTFPQEIEELPVQAPQEVAASLPFYQVAPSLLCNTTFASSATRPFKSPAPVDSGTMVLGTSYTISEKSPFPSILKKISTPSGSATKSSKFYKKDKVVLIHPTIRKPEVPVKSQSRASATAMSGIQQGPHTASGMKPPGYANVKSSGKENTDVNNMGPSKSNTKKIPSATANKVSYSRTSTNRGFLKSKSTTNLKPSNK